jgi:uncharacterized repeat protein (TIGR03806 family)
MPQFAKLLVGRLDGPGSLNVNLIRRRHDLLLVSNNPTMGEISNVLGSQTERPMVRKKSRVHAFLGLAIVVAAWSAVVAAWSGEAYAAESPELICRWARGAIQIDGQADEPAWEGASVIREFRVPVSGLAPSTKTQVRLLWDYRYLYFLAHMDDHDLFGDILEHDQRIWNNDVFEIFLKPDERSPGYYEFQVNAAGTKLDMFLPDQTSGGYDAWKSSHPFHWETAVGRRGTLEPRTDRDEGWVVEGRIPWVDLLPTGGRPDVDEIWRAAFCRYDYTLGQEPELSSSAALTRPSFHHHADYSKLRFAGSGEDDPGLRRLASRPTTLHSNVRGSPDPPHPYRAVRAYPELQLDWPIDVQVEPGTRRMLIIEEHGAYGPTKIMRTRGEGMTGELEELIDPQGVAYSLAFHPRFEENGYLYVGSNGRQGDGPNQSRIVRYALARSESGQVAGEPVMIIQWDSSGHNGAAATFGLDGMLYVTSGDGTSDSDTNDVGQDLSTLLAKVMRLDVDHPEPMQAYSIPKDNPFVGVPIARPETWAYGLRNPWRITTDRKTGHIWVGNNGQDMWEQAYLLQRGANYGWSVFEGSHPFYLHRKLGPTPHVPPTVEHPHSQSRSLTGGVVYHGQKLPDLQGAYVYGDYSTGKVWAVKHDGQRVLWHREIADTPFQLSAITVDAEGELLLLDHRGDKKGGVYALEPVPAQPIQATFPRKLSDTGLFVDLANHSMAPGLIPYSVIAPLWSDGADKHRWIALPEGGSIEVTDNGSWQFPDDTVLVKSFAIASSSEPKPTGSHGAEVKVDRWIETRLLVKQQGEWVGYSYAWNPDQSNAELVEASGRDARIALANSEGEKELAWHFPSRTECMVCHTRAANFVLGITTLQMNKDHDYGHGTVRNQLDALQAMGVIRSTWEADAKGWIKQVMKDSEVDAAVIQKDVAAMKVQEGQRGLRSRSLLGRPPSETDRLADPYDQEAALEKRVRSYLHANCAYCHVEAGGGNAQMDLSHGVTLERMKILDIKPLHHTFGMQEAKLVAPGSPERSVLLHRLGMRGPGQMPQLGTNVADERAVGLVREWIQSLAEAN